MQLDFEPENFSPEAVSQAKQEKERLKSRAFSLLESLQRVKLIEKVFFSRHLSLMLRAGLSLSRALSVLEKQTENAYFKKIIYSLRKDIEKGRTFAEALKRYPKIFSETYINLVYTGEVGGNLEEVLDELAVYLKKNYDFQRKLIGAMIYPVIILFFVVVLCILMMAFVLPRLSKLFIQLDVELPLVTQILIKISFFMQKFYYLVFLGIVIMVISFLKIRSFRFVKRILHPFLFYIPLVGNLTKKIQIARFTRSISSLLKSGLSIVSVLKIIAKGSTNILYQRAFIDVAERVKKGETLEQSLSQYKNLFPVLVVQMTKVGEETGNLVEILEKLARFYEEEVDQTVKNLSAVIEPFLMVFLGLAVGFLAFAFLMPIYSFISQIE